MCEAADLIQHSSPPILSKSFIALSYIIHNG